MDKKDSEPSDALTPREIEVMSLASEGNTSAQIARDLGCAAGTVKKHLQRSYKKLKVRNRITAVIRFAEQKRSQAEISGRIAGSA